MDGLPCLPSVATHKDLPFRGRGIGLALLPGVDRYHGDVLRAPTHRHPQVLRSLLASTGSGGNLVTDAHLAALAIEHDAILVTYDNDFDRFPAVRWEPPG